MYRFLDPKTKVSWRNAEISGAKRGFGCCILPFCAIWWTFEGWALLCCDTVHATNMPELDGMVSLSIKVKTVTIIYLIQWSNTPHCPIWFDQSNLLETSNVTIPRKLSTKSPWMARSVTTSHWTWYKLQAQPFSWYNTSEHFCDTRFSSQSIWTILSWKHERAWIREFLEGFNVTPNLAN